MDDKRKAEEIIYERHHMSDSLMVVKLVDDIATALSEARKEAVKEILESSEVVGLREFIETDCLCGPAEAPCKACWLKHNFDTLKSKHQENEVNGGSEATTQEKGEHFVGPCGHSTEDGCDCDIHGGE